MSPVALLLLVALAALSLYVGARVTRAARMSGETAPRRRGLAVAATLFITPFAAFLAVVIVADTGFTTLPGLGSAAVLVLLATGLYVLTAAPFDRGRPND